ncbi:hypothetical protein MUTS5_28570 [Escherichia coli]|uniref:hypothetical protein n=1 Tax=Escherichia coli TaxID=562 RepID=UPI00145B5889|nr:hypothetical protein MUTS5_28570 [Escherichia coli]
MYGLHRRIQGAAHCAGQGKRQTGGFLLHRMCLHMLVSGGGNADFLTTECHVPAGNHTA